VVAIVVAPFVAIIPLLKLGEFWLIAHHHYVWAAVVIVGSKVVGAALATRIFTMAPGAPGSPGAMAGWSGCRSLATAR